MFEPTANDVQTPAEKREAIRALRAEGLSYTQIAAKLGICKSTIAYHSRRLGIPADERASRRYDWRAVADAVAGGASMRECMRRFGLGRDAWAAAVKRGDIVPGEWRTPIDALLVKGPKRSRGHIKNRLLRDGLKQERCERCGITHWQGERLSLHLHHVNGDGGDNRLENLEFLCANCHSLTDTYGGRNGHRRAA